MQVVWQKNAILNEYRCIHCIQVQYCKPYVAKCEKYSRERRQASSRALTAASVAVLRTRRGRIVCDGLDVIRWRRRSNPPPDTTPLVITTFSAAVGHRKTEPGGYFCRKLTLTRTPDPIRPTRRGPDPNRPTNGRKQGVLVRGVLVGHRRRQ